MSGLRERAMGVNETQLHEASAPSGLGQDLDLGLRMVEGLVRIGEVGSAIRLTEELRLEAARSLAGKPVRPTRTARRGTSVIAGVAVALGVGLSAAAFVSPGTTDQPAERAPQIERHAEPIPVDGAPISSFRVDDQPMQMAEVMPKGSPAEDAELEAAPSDDEERRRRFAPPEAPEPLDPSSLPLIVPVPELPIE